MKALVLAAVLCLATVAHADEICADRPSKATGTCTVKDGHFFISDSAVISSGNSPSTQYLILAPTLKYGVSKRMDVEAYMPLLETITTKNAPANTGSGDLTLRAKYKILYADGHYTGPLEFGIEPFIKAPVGHVGMTDHGFEGGALAPIGLRLSDTWLLGFDPEVDVLRNKTNAGTHLATQQVVSLSHSLTSKLALSTELWTEINYDPTKRTIHQYSSDFVATYVIGKHFEIDGGANFGLNRDTPATQVFVGIAKRF